MAYGAELVLTPRELGIKGAIAKAKEIAAATPNSWIPQQFDKPGERRSPPRTTAQEILKDFPEGIDFLITGVGTGGHITGVSEVLKKTMKNLKTFAVEPAKSTVMSGGTHTPHKLQGIGDGHHPGQLPRGVRGRHIQVTEEDAFATAARAAKEEGIFVGTSSGAALAAVAQEASGDPERQQACSPSATTRASGISRSRGCSRRRPERP